MGNIKRDIELDFSIAASEFIQEKNIPNLAYLCLYGSQNYGLDTLKSDIDIKGFVYPTLENIALDQHKVSGTGLYKRGEAGEVSVIDIRTLARALKHSNINALEFLYSPYFMYTETLFSPAGNAIREIKSYRNSIVEISPDGLYRSAKGLAGNSLKRVQSLGCNKWNKQTAQVLRITNFCYAYEDSKDFDYSLKAFPIYSKNMIMSVKLGEISRELCRGVAEEAFNKIEKIEKFSVTPRVDYEKTIDEIMCSMISKLY